MFLVDPNVFDENVNNIKYQINNIWGAFWDFNLMFCPLSSFCPSLFSESYAYQTLYYFTNIISEFKYCQNK
jgi:hypothetical protein